MHLSQIKRCRMRLPHPQLVCTIPNPFTCVPLNFLNTQNEPASSNHNHAPDETMVVEISTVIRLWQECRGRLGWEICKRRYVLDIDQQELFLREVSERSTLWDERRANDTYPQDYAAYKVDESKHCIVAVRLPAAVGSAIEAYRKLPTCRNEWSEKHGESIVNLP